MNIYSFFIIIIFAQLSAQQSPVCTIRGGFKPVTGLAWKDDTTLVYPSTDNAAIFFDINRQAVIQTLKGHASHVKLIKRSPQGTYIATGAVDGSIIIWDAQNGNMQRKFDEHKTVVAGLDWTADEKLLFSGSWDNVVKAWDLSTNRNCYNKEFHEPLTAMACTPDGSCIMVATETADNTIASYAIFSGELLQEFIDHVDAVMSLAVDPRGTTLVSGSYDTTVCQWDIVNGQMYSEQEADTHSDNPIAFSQNGEMAFSQQEGTIVVVDKNDVLVGLGKHGAALCALAWSPDGTKLASASDVDKSIKIWQIN